MSSEEKTILTGTRLSDIPPGSSITILAYGAAGTGKTEFCGTAGSRAGIINCGLGIVTLQSPGFKKRHPNVNPRVETIVEEAIPDNAEAFDKVCDVADAFLDCDDVDTLIIDDVTALRRFALNKGLEINQITGKSQSLVTSKKNSARIVAVQDYGIEMDLIEQFIVEYTGICKAKNKNLIITAHERLTYNKPAQIGAPATLNSTRPGFTGQTFPDQVTQHFDFIWHFFTQGAGERILYKARTAGDSGLVAKTRWSGLFPVIVDNPNFLDIVNKVRESK